MNVEKVLKKMEELNVTGISDDTRYLQKGDLFVCFKGKNYNGNDFIIDASLKGAKAILTEDKITTATIPVITVTNISRHFDVLLAKYYDYPFREMQMIGVTGTDGKTTTASIVEYLLNQKYQCAYIGTNGIRYSENLSKTGYTTLPLCLLMKTLRLLADRNIRYVSMEVSSQGLVDSRLDSVEFDVAIFTNLTHEHLDTHKTMENYFLAKMKLFEKLDAKGLAIVNGDSPYSYRIRHPNLVTYGIENVCDYQAMNIRYQKKYTVFDLKTPEGILENVKINMMGTYNIYNIMAAMITAIHYRIPIPVLYKALQTIPKIDGRLELLTTTENFKVYVDFAHTPNAIREVLTNLKKDGSYVTIVMGCAGGKDKTKRPEMGRVATAIADHVIFTSEDPRLEDPMDIIRDLLKEVTKDNYEIIVDRKQAIRNAIVNAKENDIVIITGKGNDTYFEISNHVYSYSDITEVVDALSCLKK
jgi:UDP-N-acetylmuramyl-tripeptide synthetase